jgi:hypothetical protein
MMSLNFFGDMTETQRNRRIKSQLRNQKISLPYQFKYKNAWDWDKAMAQKLLCGEHDSAKVILACHYIKTYGFNITEDNPRIKDFDCITEWCNRNNVRLYYNLLAENVDYADSLVGKELVFLMRQNRDYIRDRYTKKGCVVIDNLEEVKGKNYVDQNWTTEHYNYKGRMTLAKNIALRLRAQFNNSFKQAY